MFETPEFDDIKLLIIPKHQYGTKQHKQKTPITFIIKQMFWLMLKHSYTDTSYHFPEKGRQTWAKTEMEV